MEAEAWLSWVQTFEGVPVDNLAALSNAQTLQLIMRQVSPAKFECSLQESSNWVSRFNNLKRLHRLLTKELATLNVRIRRSRAAPNLSLVAKDASTGEIIKLLELLLLVAVAGDQRTKFVQRIASLSQKSQTILMKGIENTTNDFPIKELLHSPQQSSDVLTARPESEDALSVNDADDAELRRSYEKLKEHCELLSAELAEEKTVNMALSEAFAELNNKPELATDSETDTHLNRQYLELQNQFLVTENQLALKVAQFAEQDELITQMKAELSKKSESSNDALVLLKMQDEQAQVRANNERLEVVNAKYRKKLTQDAAEAVLLEERVAQLEARNESLLGELKTSNNKLEDAKRDLSNMVVKNSDDHESQYPNDESTSMSSRNLSSLNIVLNDQLPSGESSMSLSASIVRPRTPTVQRSLENELLSIQDNSRLPESKPITLQYHSFHDAEGKLLQAVDIRRELGLPDEKASRLGHENRQLLELIAIQANELNLVRKHIAEDSLTRLNAEIQALWQSQGGTTIVPREGTMAGQAQSPIEQTISSPESEAFGSSIIPFSRRGDENRDAELSRYRETQIKMTKLLKKQDSLLKNYRQRYEELQQKGIDSSIKSEKEAVEEQFAAYRRKAESRETQLKQENTLVARAFYDIATKYNVLNKSSGARSNATPVSFLGKRRAALGVMSPMPSRIT